MKTRSKGASPSTEVTAFTGKCSSGCPIRVIWSPSSLSSLARALLTSSRVTSSPARVRDAPTSPPSAPAPTIRMRIRTSLAASAVLPRRTALVVERRDPFADVFGRHQLAQEDALGLPPRLLERPACQLAAEAHVHAHHHRAGPPEVL